MSPFDSTPQTFRLTPVRLIRMASPVLIFFGISLYLHPQEWTQHWLWPQTVMSLLLTMLALGSLLMPKVYYLVLDHQGFTMNYIGTKRFYSWDEVSNFRSVENVLNHLPVGQKLVFDLRPDSPQKTELIRAARAIRTFIPIKSQEYDVSILSLFKPSAQEIALLMNTWAESRPPSVLHS